MNDQGKNQPAAQDQGAEQQPAETVTETSEAPVVGEEVDGTEESTEDDGSAGE